MTRNIGDDGSRENFLYANKSWFTISNADQRLFLMPEKRSNNDVVVSLWNSVASG